jgi:magnesium transporter
VRYARLVIQTARLYRDGSVAEEGFDPTRISDLLEEPGAVVWLDLEVPTKGELAMLQEEFGLHPLAIEDAVHRNQRTKVEAYEGYSFLVLHSITWRDGELADQEIHAFVGSGYLITLRYDPAFDLGPVRQRWERQPELAKEGGGMLLHALLDQVVDGYFDVVERLETESEGLESAVFSDRPAADVQERIFDLKKQVLRFRRLVLPLRDVLNTVQEELRIVTDPLRPYYRDVADHLARVLDWIDNVRELVVTALQAQLAQVGNRQNQVMKQVTSWAAIILVPTLIAGIYGMNFIRPFPDFDNPAGFWVAVVLMVVAGGILYGVFRRRGWI